MNADDPMDVGNGPRYHTGRDCIEAGCREPAGTAWSPYWCQRHNAERMHRIEEQLAAVIPATSTEGEP